MKYRINGKVTIEGGEPEMPLYVFAVFGREVNEFRLEGSNVFTTEREATAAEIRNARVWIFGLKGKDDDVVPVAPFSKTLDPNLWHRDNGAEVYDFEADLTWEDIEPWEPDVVREEWAGLLSPYNLRGKVTTDLNGTVVGVPNARIEVIEYDPARRKSFADRPMPPGQVLLNPPLAERRDTLGTITTDDDGEFEFSFVWYPWDGMWPHQPDWAPDIILRVTQLVDGRSVLLAETETRMSLDANPAPWQIEVPIEHVPLLPRPRLPRMAGTFQHIGYLPVDTTRIDTDGYATSQEEIRSPAGDLLQPADLVQCRKAPFGGVLDIYARFGVPNVTHYRFRYARWADGRPTDADFLDVTDALANFYRKTPADPWRGRALGPRRTGGVDSLYESIEQQDPQQWLFDELKLRWTTEKLDNGKYTLRIEGFHYDPSTDAATPVSAVSDEVVLRLDNTRPIARILGLYQGGQPVDECSIIRLTGNSEQLEVKVHVQDPEGHLGSWHLSTAYGRDRGAGARFAHAETYPNPNDGGFGPGTVRLAVPNQPGEAWPATCGYNFGLSAYGRSTDGRSIRLGSQRASSGETTYIMRV